LERGVAVLAEAAATSSWVAAQRGLSELPNLDWWSQLPALSVRRAGPLSMGHHWSKRCGRTQ